MSNYTISQEKLEQVTSIFNAETDPEATKELVKSEICADWNEGDEHQNWIDNASAQDIANWLATFYS